MSSRKRKVLTSEKRVAVLNKIESGKFCRCVVEEIGVDKTQIQNIVKNKDSYFIRVKSREFIYTITPFIGLKRNCEKL